MNVVKPVRASVRSRPKILCWCACPHSESLQSALNCETTREWRLWYTGWLKGQTQVLQIEGTTKAIQRTIPIDWGPRAAEEKGSSL